MKEELQPRKIKFERKRRLGFEKEYWKNLKNPSTVTKAKKNKKNTKFSKMFGLTALQDNSFLFFLN